MYYRSALRNFRCYFDQITIQSITHRPRSAKQSHSKTANSKNALKNDIPKRKALKSSHIRFHIHVTTINITHLLIQHIKRTIIDAIIRRGELPHGFQIPP